MSEAGASEGAHRRLLHSGGSFSVAAQHFCPVCGIIATSAANLQVGSGLRGECILLCCVSLRRQMHIVAPSSCPPEVLLTELS